MVWAMTWHRCPVRGSTRQLVSLQVHPLPGPHVFRIHVRLGEQLGAPRFRFGDPRRASDGSVKQEHAGVACSGVPGLGVKGAGPAGSPCAPG